MTVSIAQPCPFCGHVDVEIDETSPKVYAVVCPECEAIGPASRCTPEDAIDKWNLRWWGRADLSHITPLSNPEWAEDAE